MHRAVRTGIITLWIAAGIPLIAWLAFRWPFHIFELEPWPWKFWTNLVILAVLLYITPSVIKNIRQRMYSFAVIVKFVVLTLASILVGAIFVPRLLFDLTSERVIDITTSKFGPNLSKGIFWKNGIYQQDSLGWKRIPSSYGESLFETVRKSDFSQLQTETCNYGLHTPNVKAIVYQNNQRVLIDSCDIFTDIINTPPRPQMVPIIEAVNTLASYD